MRSSIFVEYYWMSENSGVELYKFHCIMIVGI